MDNSILNTIKKMLGIEPDYTAFDTDISAHINTALMILNQLGVGRSEGVVVAGPDTTWDALFLGRTDLAMVKSYIYHRVRLAFDPPQNSFVTAAIEKQITEFEWRVNVQAESTEPDPAPVDSDAVE